MLWGYLKLAYRNLRKNKVSSFINLLGLSLAIGVAIVCYLLNAQIYGIDAHHEHADRIFLVEHTAERYGRVQTFASSPAPLVPAMAADFPQIERAVRMAFSFGTVTAGGHTLPGGVTFADEGFLHMFSFPLTSGDREVLAHRDQVVLSAASAQRFFGTNNPVGQPLSVTFNDGQTLDFTVGAVAAAFPDNAGLRFELLASYAPYEASGLGPRSDDWSAKVAASFIQLREARDLTAVAAGMGRYRALQNAAVADAPLLSFEFDKLAQLAPRASVLSESFIRGMPPMAGVVFGLLGLFLLALACVNYMNIAIATAAQRLKEIGVRKVVGGSKAQLVLQFLAENVLLCLLALVLGIAAAKFILLPGYNLLPFHGAASLGLTLAGNVPLWMFLAGLVVVTGLASGAYPAFYITSFSPMAVFRGRQELANRNRFVRGLLVFQFVLAFLTLITGAVMRQNIAYQQEQDWGYHQENVFVVPLHESGQFAALRDALARQPDVLQTAGSVLHVGGTKGGQPVVLDGQEMISIRFEVGYDYLETMGIPLKAGRFFDAARPGDAAGAIVVNETFARFGGWEDPVGQVVRIDTTSFLIAGVVEDFHYDHFADQIRPVFFRLVPDEGAYHFLVARVAAGAGGRTATAIEATWKRLFPEAAFEGFFQDTVFDDYFRQVGNLTRIFGFLSLLALLLACMGFFGLVAQRVTRRLKEIGIRKVMGATLFNLIGLLNREFLGVLGLAVLIATPLAYFATKGLLDVIFAFHVPLGPVPFLFSYAVIFGTALLTVSTQLYRVATTNPADVLRTD